MRPAARVALSIEPEFACDGSKRLVKNVDAVRGLVLVDDQRRIDANGMGIRHRDETTFQRLVEQGTGDGRIQRLLSALIGNHFNTNHQTAPPHVPDKAVLLLQRFKAIEQQRSHPRRVFDQVFLENDFHRAETGGSGQWVPAVARRASAWLAKWLGGHALERGCNGAEWKAAPDPFSDSHDVGLDVELLGGPHRTGSAEAGQDFIGDEQCVEYIGDVAHSLNEIVGWDYIARSALHRFQNDRGDLALRVVLHDVSQMLRAG